MTSLHWNLRKVYSFKIIPFLEVLENILHVHFVILHALFQKSYAGRPIHLKINLVLPNLVKTLKKEWNIQLF